MVIETEGFGSLVYVVVYMGCQIVEQAENKNQIGEKGLFHLFPLAINHFDPYVCRVIYREILGFEIFY